jgi:hypothetical protein
MRLKRHQKLKLRRDRLIPRPMLDRPSRCSMFHIKTRDAVDGLVDARLTEVMQR